MQVLSALYTTVDDAESTIRALEAAGIPHDDVGLLVAEPAPPAPGDMTAPRDETASGAKTGGALGAVFGGGTGLLAGLGTIMVPGFGPVVAAGWWAAAAVGAVGGAIAGTAAGGLTGKLVELGLPAEQARRHEAGIRQGAILLTVRVDEARAPGAEALLSKYHPLERSGMTPAAS